MGYCQSELIKYLSDMLLASSPESLSDPGCVRILTINKCVFVRARVCMRACVYAFVCVRLHARMCVCVFTINVFLWFLQPISTAHCFIYITGIYICVTALLMYSTSHTT